LRFGAFVPHADQIEGAGEHGAFRETEEEARGEEAAPIVDETLADGDEAEEEHAG